MNVREDARMKREEASAPQHHASGTVGRHVRRGGRPRPRSRGRQLAPPAGMGPKLVYEEWTDPGKAVTVVYEGLGAIVEMNGVRGNGPR